MNMYLMSAGVTQLLFTFENLVIETHVGLLLLIHNISKQKSQWKDFHVKQRQEVFIALPAVVNALLPKW